MHGLAFYVKQGLPFAQGFSLENSAESYLCFRLALVHSASYFFSLCQSPTFNVYHKDWLTFSGGTYRSGELCYSFSISNNLILMVNFLTQILYYYSHSFALLDLFIFF